jgi:hypothetical protein
MASMRATKLQRGEGSMSDMSIIQVIPADGWRAMFVHEDVNGSQEGFSITTYPLVCWALTEEDGIRGVVGMAPMEYGVDVVSAHRGWFGYLGPGEKVEDFREDARRHLEVTRNAGLRSHWQRSALRHDRASA